MLQTSCKNFADNVLKPQAANVDAGHLFPADAVLFCPSLTNIDIKEGICD